MKQYRKQILFLIIGTAVFTELLSSNLTLVHFLNPIILLFILTIGYGFPVLLVRELVVRKGMGLASLFMLGLAYGIWNEGILARTLLLNTNVPVNYFDGYVGELGINFAWASQIVTWHSLLAITLPITFVHYFFKDESSQAWISIRMYRGLGLITAIFGTLIFFGEASDRGAKGNAEQFIIFVGLMIMFYLLAVVLRNKIPLKHGPIKGIKALFLIGFCFIWFFFIGIGGVLAGVNADTVFFYAAYAVLIFLCNRLLKRKGSITIESIVACGFGAYFSQGLFSMIFSPIPIVIVTEVVLLVMLVIVLFKTRKNLMRDQ